MKEIGVLLTGLSLLTLAVVIILDKVAEPLFSIANNPTYASPILGYILIGIVFFLGIVLIFFKR